MIQSIAQIVAIVNYGNKFILQSDKSKKQTVFSLDHSTAQFHSNIEFHKRVSQGGVSKSEKLAKSSNHTVYKSFQRICK